MRSRGDKYSRQTSSRLHPHRISWSPYQKRAHIPQGISHSRRDRAFAAPRGQCRKPNCPTKLITRACRSLDLPARPITRKTLTCSRSSTYLAVKCKVCRNRWSISKFKALSLGWCLTIRPIAIVSLSCKKSSKNTRKPRLLNVANTQLPNKHSPNNHFRNSNNTKSSSARPL